MIKNIKGDTSSYYELIFFTYLSIIIIHFCMVYIDTSFYNYIIVFNKISNINSKIVFQSSQYIKGKDYIPDNNN